MTSLEARKHPSLDQILIIQTPGRIIRDDYPAMRQLVDQLLEILAQHDPANRVEH